MLYRASFCVTARRIFSVPVFMDASRINFQRRVTDARTDKEGKDPYEF